MQVVQVADREEPWLMDCVAAGREGGKRNEAWVGRGQLSLGCVNTSTVDVRRVPGAHRSMSIDA